MSSAHEIYQRHLRQQLGANGFAVWPPGRVLQLGDIGVLGSGGDFQKCTDLKQLGLEPRIERGSLQPILSATSLKERDTAAHVGATTLGVQNELKLKFGAKGSVIFEVQNFQHIQIGNLSEIVAQVLDLYDKGTWASSWCLIDQVWHASAGTIAVSTSANFEMSIRGHASGPVPSLTCLANPDVAAQFEVRGEDMVKVIGGRNLTPMVTCMRINFFKNNLKRISTGQGEQEPLYFARLSLDEIETAWRGPEKDID